MSILFVENPSDLPPGMDLDVSGPTIAVRTNPSDPYGKVLVIAGADPTQLVTAARAIALQNAMLQGRTARVSDFELPSPREADDAPLWMSTERISPFWNYTDNAELRSDGSGPLAVYLRVPPDLYYGDRSTIPLDVDYRYNAIPLSNGSTLRVTANGTLVNELPLPHSDNPKKESVVYGGGSVDRDAAFREYLSLQLLFSDSQDRPLSGRAADQSAGRNPAQLAPRSRGIEHWAAMPNLELFSNAGFPFHPVRRSVADDGGDASDGH